MINPQNIHCLALNFQGVGNQSEIPLYFVKSLSALCFEGAQVPCPKNSESMWTEVELGVVIAEDCRNVKESDAHQFIAGYTVCADITCKNLHGRDHHLGFSKSRENFCPVMDGMVQISPQDLPGLLLTTEINGQITQSGYLREIRYDAFKSVAFISEITVLKKGDIILTGTPKGVENNIIHPGDRVKQSISGIGSLSYVII